MEHAAGCGVIGNYDRSWRSAAAFFPSKRLDEILPSDILALLNHVTDHARRRSSSRNGRAARETMLRGLRALYRLAVMDGLISANHNPAARIPLPRRLPSPRFALSADQLADINQVAVSGGQDVPLDCLLLRLHTETACRRGGALAARLGDLDTTYCLLRLHEKGETVRWQPISPTLTTALAEHARSRGAAHPTDPLLRYSSHQPLSTRRYDHLWTRIRDRLPWAAAQHVSTHWLRHTTITWVERHYGYGIARAYAGHTDAKGTSTATYIKADLQAVATALAAMTGQPHPLAHPHPTNPAQRCLHDRTR